MNKSIGLQLIVYGLLLVGLSYLVHHLSPAIARTTLTTGLAGGLLCCLWGAVAVVGNRRKVFSVLTLIPICYLLLGQAIMKWRGNPAEAAHHGGGVLIITLLFVLSLGMLMRILYAGMAMQAPPAQSNTDRQVGGKRT
jgi:hypothetical protein